MESVWDVWRAGQNDPEYKRLYMQMYELERKFEDTVGGMDDAVQDVIRDYVMHCEAMSWRMLEFACEQRKSPKR